MSTDTNKLEKQGVSQKKESEMKKEVPFPPIQISSTDPQFNYYLSSIQKKGQFQEEDIQVLKEEQAVETISFLLAAIKYQPQLSFKEIQEQKGEISEQLYHKVLELFQKDKSLTSRQIFEQLMDNQELFS